MSKPGDRAEVVERTGEEAALVALLEAPSTEEATRNLLARLGRLIDARYAVLWTLDEAAELLRWAAHWVAEPGVEALANASQRLSFPRAQGVPGRTWDAGRVVWIPDVLDPQSHFVRSQSAAEVNLNAVAAIPIYGRQSFLGVVELFVEQAPEEPPALHTLNTIGQILGAYLERRRVEQRLAASEDLRTAMVNASLDCVITIDCDSRIIDFNPAAERTFGHSREYAVGSSIADLIIPPEYRAAHYSAIARVCEGGKSRLLDRRIELEAMRGDGVRFPVELTLTRIDRPEKPLFVGFLRDITERQQTQKSLAQLLQREQEARVRAEQAEQRARRIAATLQRSLLPPVLPAIAGLDIAAGFHAGGEGTEVGGDFYDIFATGPHSWSWVIGDVCGKGAEAASLTALARYTIRAATIHEPEPSDVLRVLNDALLREQPASGFLTAIMGRLDLSGSSARMSVAIGGHPPLLILRADGEVEGIGPSGTLLGAIPEPKLVDSEVVLERGDTVVAYTDGVIEARVGDGRLELEGLIEVLRGRKGARATEIGRAIEEAAVGTVRRATDDDVAFLIIRLRDDQPV